MSQRCHRQLLLVEIAAVLSIELLMNKVAQLQRSTYYNRYTSMQLLLVNEGEALFLEAFPGLRTPTKI